MSKYYFNETQKKQLSDYTLEDFMENGEVKEPLITYEEYKNVWQPSFCKEIAKEFKDEAEVRDTYRVHMAHLRIYLSKKYGYERKNNPKDT